MKAKEKIFVNGFLEGGGLGGWREKAGTGPPV
jgi:hypothetical protein